MDARRGYWVRHRMVVMAGTSAATAALIAGLPIAHADFDDLIGQVADAAAESTGAAGAADSAAIPLTVHDVTEPVVDVSVGGGSSIPVLVDTGSTGLVIPWQDFNPSNASLPVGFGVDGFEGSSNTGPGGEGVDYFYVTMDSPVTFTEADGTQITTAPTPINVELFAWNTSTLAPANLNFVSSAVDGVLGIGPNIANSGLFEIGQHPSDVFSALPGNLSDGVLIDQPGGTLEFGPDPLHGGTVVDGAPLTTGNVEVSLDGGPPVLIPAMIDSGGVYGTLPATAFGATTGDVLPPGTQVSVMTADGEQLYHYTVGTDALGDSTSPVASSDTTMNTGNIPFELGPVYISGTPSPGGSAVFGGTR